jgi:Mrp family chromosome partitioning ATPase
VKVDVGITSQAIASPALGVTSLWHRNRVTSWPWNSDDTGRSLLRERAQSVALAVSSTEHRSRTHGMVFASANAGDGTSTITLAVARVLQNALGLTPLVVEMNWQRPCLAERLDLTASNGSVHAMYKEHAILADCVQRDQSGLSIIVAGGEWPSASASKLACRILQDAEPDYDAVLFDAPPVLESADAIACGTSAKEMIVVARAGFTSGDALAQVKALADSGAVLIRGSVLTMAKTTLPRWLDRFLTR